MYSVLKFPETEDPTEIVPTSWIDEIKMKTKWPPYNQPEKILKAIRKCIKPENNWPEYTYVLLVCKCDDYEEASEKRKNADLFSDIENTEKIKQTRKNRHKKILLSDHFYSDDSHSPPLEIIKPHSQCTMSQSHKNNSTNICDTFKKRAMNVCVDVNANDSYSPPQKVIKTYSRCTTSHKNDSTKIVDYEETMNSEQSYNFNSESELEKNESDFENDDKNKIEFGRIKENNYVNAIASKNRISTSKVNIMLPSGECKEIVDETAKNRNNNSQSDTQQKRPFDVDNFATALRLILTKQNKIVQQNEIIMAKITTLEKKISQETSHCQLSNQTKDKLCKTFIIKTVNDLEEFDACLKKKKYFDEVVEFIKQKGGPDVRSHVFNILNSTISNSVATQYSYKGQKKKKRFLDLMFNTCIFKAAQMHTPSATDDNVRTAIAGWLDNSSSRLKNELNKRAKEPNLHMRMEFDEENDSED